MASDCWMMDFDALEASEEASHAHDELLSFEPLFLVVQKFNVVRTAPSLQATALGTKFQGDCVAAAARRGHWLRVLLGEKDAETWMLEVGDPIGSPGERLLELAPEAMVEWLRIGLRLSGTQSLLQHHRMQLSGRKLSRVPANGPVCLGAFATGLEARHSPAAPICDTLPGVSLEMTMWADQEWQVFTMRSFKKGEVVERCELIPLRTEMAFAQRERELTSFDHALLWQERHAQHPPAAVFPSGYTLLYRLVHNIKDGVTLTPAWSQDGSAVLLKAPHDLDVGTELCLSESMRETLLCSCVGLKGGPPKSTRPEAPRERGNIGETANSKDPQSNSAVACRNSILQVDGFLRAGLVQAGPSVRQGRGVFALGRFSRNATIEICPTFELDEVGHLALLDFVMKFKTNNQERIIAPLGCGMLYNHSDQPNVRWQCVPNVGGGLVVMTALRNIEEGEELLINYGDKYWCGARHGDHADGRPSGEAHPHPYHIAGSWNDYQPTPMEPYGDGLWRYTVTLSQTGQASFQVLLWGSWNHAIYPSESDANPFVQHKLLGPDSGGHGINWTIGKHPKDVSKPGTVYDVVLSVDSRAAATDVTWHRCIDGRPGHWV